MTYLRLVLLVGTVFPFVAVPLSATPTPVPLFTECPQVGQGLGCTFLLVFGPHGHVNLLSDSNVKDVDGQEHVLVGIQNNSGSYINLADHNRPDKLFSGLHLTGGLRDGKSTYFNIKDPSENDDEKNGKDDDKEDDDHKNPTPEPSSMVLLGTGLAALGGILRRKLLS